MHITTVINIPTHKQTVGQHQNKMRVGEVEVWVSRHISTKVSYKPVVMTEVSLSAGVYFSFVFHVRLQFPFLLSTKSLTNDGCHCTSSCLKISYT